MFLLVNWTQTGDSVYFTLTQTQSSPTVSFFKLPVEIKLKNASHDTLIRVNNLYSGQGFTVHIPFKADSLIFDPNYQIISGNNTVNAVAEHNLQPSLQVVPNPASDHVTFRLGGLTTGIHGSIRIYDDTGRMWDELLPEAGADEIVLNTRNYSPGLYFYVFSCQYFQESGKFIISR